MKKPKSNFRQSSAPPDMSILTTVEGDCFGTNEWNATDSACLNCSEYNTCMVYVLTTQTKTYKDKFIDLWDFSQVPWDSFLELVENEPKSVSLVELRQAVKTLSKCTDDKSVNAQVQNWMIKNQLKVTEGWVQK